MWKKQWYYNTAKTNENDIRCIGINKIVKGLEIAHLNVKFSYGRTMAYITIAGRNREQRLCITWYKTTDPGIYDQFAEMHRLVGPADIAYYGIKNIKKVIERLLISTTPNGIAAKLKSSREHWFINGKILRDFPPTKISIESLAAYMLEQKNLHHKDEILDLYDKCKMIPTPILDTLRKLSCF